MTTIMTMMMLWYICSKQIFLDLFRLRIKLKIFVNMR
jgi:hypothetical protein